MGALIVSPAGGLLSRVGHQRSSLCSVAIFLFRASFSLSLRSSSFPGTFYTAVVFARYAYQFEFPFIPIQFCPRYCQSVSADVLELHFLRLFLTTRVTNQILHCDLLLLRRMTCRVTITALLYVICTRNRLFF